MNLSTLLFLIVFTVVARWAWRRGARAVAAGFGAAALLFAVSLWRSSNPIVLAVVLLAAGFVVWQRWGRTAATVTRWGAMLRRKDGVASGWDIIRRRGVLAMRRRAATLRPSLAVDTRRDRWAQLTTLPVTEVAVPLCRVGPTRVYASHEEVVCTFGGPRVGKTQQLAGQIIDAPGAVIVTSTRTDLLDQTGPLRAQRGPVYVFNPVGLGGRESTVTFDPLTGCDNPVTAAERASDMLAGAQGYGGRSGDREFWDDQGQRNLAALLHAAALAGNLSMGHVQTWLSDLEGHSAQILGLLRNHSPEPAFEASVTQFINTNERTRSSITATIAPALAWLTHKPARAAARPARDGGNPLDVAHLLAERGSAYMLGGEEAQVAPLVCAMTGWIAREARRLAAFCPGGRLDPPLAFRLDECALICPIPLHQWSADMGGRGVSIVACFQSRAQLIDRWGEAKAATIINNAGGKELFGGTGDREDLQYWSTLAGERDEPTLTTDMHGRVASRTTRRVPVLAPAQIATLPPGRVVVFTSNMPPVIGRAERAYERLDVRAHHTPNVLTVRARLWAGATVARIGVWVWAQAVPLMGALIGLVIGAPHGAEAAVEAGHAPWWVGWLSGGFVGVTAGLLAGHLAVVGWREWRPPIVAWLARRLLPLWAWLGARWTRMWTRFTGRGATHYRPYGEPDPVTEPLPVVVLAAVPPAPPAPRAEP